MLCPEPRGPSDLAGGGGEAAWRGAYGWVGKPWWGREEKQRSEINKLFSFRRRNWAAFLTEAFGELSGEWGSYPNGAERPPLSPGSEKCRSALSLRNGSISKLACEWAEPSPGGKRRHGVA